MDPTKADPVVSTCTRSLKNRCAFFLGNKTRRYVRVVIDSHKFQFVMESGIITKRKALSDITNEKCSPELEKYNVKTWLPITPVEQDNSIPVSKSNIHYQNVHPVLPSYKHDLHTTTMSPDQLSFLLRDENEAKLVKLLQDTGVFAKIQNCKFCGGNMKINQMKTCWYWVCYRRVNGIKCNS